MGHLKSGSDLGSLASASLSTMSLGYKEDSRFCKGEQAPLGEKIFLDQTLTFWELASYPARVSGPRYLRGTLNAWSSLGMCQPYFLSAPAEMVTLEHP